MVLLDNASIQECRDELIVLKEQIAYVKQAVETVIKSFENNDIVKSLYSSGKFGAEEQEKIKRIRDGINKYCNTLLYNSDGLFIRTYQFLDEQEALNQKGVN